MPGCETLLGERRDSWPGFREACGARSHQGLSVRSRHCEQQGWDSVTAAQWAEVPDLLLIQEAVGYIRCQALGQEVRETLEEGWPFLLCPVVWPVSGGTSVRPHAPLPSSGRFLTTGLGVSCQGLVHPVLPSTGCLFLPAVLMTFLMAKQIASLLAFVPSTGPSLRDGLAGLCPAPAETWSQEHLSGDSGREVQAPVQVGAAG